MRQLPTGVWASDAATSSSGMAWEPEAANIQPRVHARALARVKGLYLHALATKPGAVDGEGRCVDAGGGDGGVEQVVLEALQKTGIRMQHGYEFRLQSPKQLASLICKAHTDFMCSDNAAEHKMYIEASCSPLALAELADDGNHL